MLARMRTVTRRTSLMLKRRVKQKLHRQHRQMIQHRLQMRQPRLRRRLIRQRIRHQERQAQAQPRLIPAGQQIRHQVRQAQQTQPQPQLKPRLVPRPLISRLPPLIPTHLIPQQLPPKQIHHNRHNRTKPPQPRIPPQTLLLLKNL